MRPWVGVCGGPKGEAKRAQNLYGDYRVRRCLSVGLPHFSAYLQQIRVDGFFLNFICKCDKTTLVPFGGFVVAKPKTTKKIFSMVVAYSQML